MNILKTTGTIFWLSILIISILIFSLTLALNSLLYPSIYTNAFEKVGVYEYLDNNLNSIPAVKFITIPPEGPRPLVDLLVSNFLAYMRSDTDTLNLSIKVNTDELRNFFIDSVKKIPTCLPNQNQFAQGISCIPKGKNQTQFLDEFLKTKNISFFEDDAVDLTEIYNLGTESYGKETLDSVRMYLRYYKLFIIISSIAIVVLIFLIYLFQRSNIRTFLEIIGIGLLVPALFLFLATHFVKLIPNHLVVSDQISSQILKAVIDVLNNKLIIYSIILLSISALFFILSIFAKSKLPSSKPKNK